MNYYGFYTGQIFDAYEYLGAHLENGGVTFRTFAPNANAVNLLFRNEEIPMNKVHDGNFYEIHIDDAKEGETYEYKIYAYNSSQAHADPYGYGMELRPDHKSVIRDNYSYTFTDNDWMMRRSNNIDNALNIYELHLGSWRKNDDNWYNYEEIADLLIPYLKETGYNYVEFLPISEHPCDESWGYQNTGFYSPTSRYGTMNNLKKMIDKLHNNNIGVILDFVPVHFAVDDYALAKYDGSALYEYPHNDVGVSEWGSYNFMHSRGEVRSFLQSSANYWLKEYHFDGLRLDAISRIIYWQGDEKRGVNGNAVEFIKYMNRELKNLNKGIMLIAEDSTNFPNVTKSPDKGGLGFDYKWDMGWMHDTLNYFKLPPNERYANYHKLTFSMMYFYNEQYLLPYSHDEVVHGKATILQKMYGDYDNKFPQGRAMYMYMMLHPGKKLNFMGNEIGQLREWDEKREQDWMLRDFPIHDAFYNYMKTLNNIYLNEPALSEDYKEINFSWLDCHSEDKCIYSIKRSSSKDKTEKIIGIFNFSDNYHEGYRLHIDDNNFNPDNLTVVLNSDYKKYGGNTNDDETIYYIENGDLVINIPAFTGILLKY